MQKSRGNTEQPVEDEGYFVSMTDMMVGLLFIFILILMYFALQYHRTTEQLTSANKTRGEILESVGKNLKEHGFDVEIDPDSGILRLNEKVLRFASGEATLDAQYLPVVKALAAALGQVLPCYTPQGVCKENSDKHWLEAVFVEGHTDNVPVLGGNLKLSTERAVNTYDKLTAENPAIERLTNPDGLPLLSVSGYGEKRPHPKAHDNDTQQHRDMNRRIELRIIMATPKADRGTQSVADQIGKVIK